MGESRLASAGLPITFCRGHDAILHGILQFLEPRSRFKPEKADADLDQFDQVRFSGGACAEEEEKVSARASEAA